MATERDLSRISLRKDQVVELHLDKFPEPPAAMMKLPGVAQWWSEMRLMRERDIQALYRFVNNINATQLDPTITGSVSNST